MSCVVRVNLHAYTDIGMNGKSTTYTFKTSFKIGKPNFKSISSDTFEFVNMKTIMKFSCTLIASG